MEIELYPPESQVKSLTNFENPGLNIEKCTKRPEQTTFIGGKGLVTTNMWNIYMEYANMFIVYNMFYASMHTSCMQDHLVS